VANRVLSKKVRDLHHKRENLEFNEYITHLTFNVPEKFATQGMEGKSTLKFMDIDNMLDQSVLDASLVRLLVNVPSQL
jgi:hypothetical protein